MIYLPVSFRATSIAPGRSHDSPSANEVHIWLGQIGQCSNMKKYYKSKPVCKFFGIYCMRIIVLTYSTAGLSYGEKSRQFIKRRFILCLVYAIDKWFYIKYLLMIMSRSLQFPLILNSRVVKWAMNCFDRTRFANNTGALNTMWCKCSWTCGCFYPEHRKHSRDSTIRMYTGNFVWIRCTPIKTDIIGTHFIIHSLTWIDR